MLCGIKTNQDNVTNYGNCESDYPYCDDNGFCRKNKKNDYTGLNKKYNHKYNIFLIILGFILLFFCLYISYRITINLIEGCRDGDLFSCFILFNNRR